MTTANLSDSATALDREAAPPKAPRKPRTRRPKAPKVGPAPTPEPTPMTSPSPQDNGLLAGRVKTGATVTMGAFIPLLSLGLSHAGGTLVGHHRALAGMSFGLMGCVLVVSLSHLAWAIGDITRSPWWASWLLAVAFDLCLVFGELTNVSATAAGLGVVVTAIMVAVAGLSMFLNCWAFLHHPAGE